MSIDVKIIVEHRCGFGKPSRPSGQTPTQFLPAQFKVKAEAGQPSYGADPDGLPLPADNKKE